MLFSLIVLFAALTTVTAATAGCSVARVDFPSLDPDHLRRLAGRRRLGIFIFLMIVYSFLTNVELRRGDVWPGALFATTVFMICYQIVPLYLRFSSDVAAYRAFGGILVLLVWLYLMANVIVMGAEINWNHWNAASRPRSTWEDWHERRDRARPDRPDPHHRARHRPGGRLLPRRAGHALLFQVPGQPMAFFDCGGVRLYLGAAESPEFTRTRCCTTRWTTSRPPTRRSPSAAPSSSTRPTPSTATPRASCGSPSCATPRATPWPLMEQRTSGLELLAQRGHRPGAVRDRVLLRGAHLGHVRVSPSGTKAGS